VRVYILTYCSEREKKSTYSMHVIACIDYMRGRVEYVKVKV